jgi:hypothetical protein
MFIRRVALHLAALSPAFLAQACVSALGPASFEGFDASALNATWYGAYVRPIEQTDSAAVEAARVAAEQRLAAREESRANRQQQRALAREQRREDRRRPSPAPQNAVANHDPEPAPVPVVAGPLRPAATDERYDPVLAMAYVRATYELNGQPFPDDAVMPVDIYRLATRSGGLYHTEYPAAGDVVFFSNTHDMNADGRDNDFYSHVGIVEAVADDGTVSIISYMDGGVQHTSMNLVTAHERELNGREVNTPMRARQGEDGSAAWLSSHLTVGFAAFLGPEVETVHLIDQWQPDATSVASFAD